MQRSIWSLLILCFLTITFACSTNDSDKEKEPEPTGYPLDAHLNQRYQDDLSGLLERKYIRVLTTLNRTNFFISEGHLVGYEYSLLKDYETYLNQQIHKKNNLKIVLEFLPVARDELLPKLVNGYGDIAAAGLTITEERKKKIDFTNPYLTGIKEITVTSKGQKNLKTIDDLSGKKIYVRKSSSYYQSLAKLNEKFREQKKKPVKIVTLSEELETESILEMVNSGAIDITIADNHIARAWSKLLHNLEIHEDIILREGSQIAWMVRKNNPELQSSLNAFLKTHTKGTLLGNIYFNRYFKKVDKLKNPSEIENWEKVKQYKEVIQKYAEKYEFDWLLILAMAFQESGLDHSRKSGAGAVGLMQILPSTAKDKKIAIDHIDQVENNVHAGVKYLDFLRDRYFSTEKIRIRDQIRLALASYNAGPAKIQKARKLAEKMGLNKNEWFRNVEIAVLRIVGQETVRYVSNINKYYVLYQAILDQEQRNPISIHP